MSQQPNEDWEGSVEGSVKMICGYYLSKEMARTALRAQSSQELFTREFEHLISFLRAHKAAWEDEQKKSILERFGHFREAVTGRTLRFYLLPHTQLTKDDGIEG